MLFFIKQLTKLILDFKREYKVEPAKIMEALELLNLVPMELDFNKRIVIVIDKTLATMWVSFEKLLRCCLSSKFSLQRIYG